MLRQRGNFDHPPACSGEDAQCVSVCQDDIFLGEHYKAIVYMTKEMLES